jgi:hypothetical protein
MNKYRKPIPKPKPKPVEKPLAKPVEERYGAYNYDNALDNHSTLITVQINGKTVLDIDVSCPDRETCIALANHLLTIYTLPRIITEASK